GTAPIDGATEVEGQITVAVVVAVEQHQLLRAVTLVDERVEVQDNLLGRGAAASEKRLQQHLAQPLQVRGGDGVLKAGEGGLARQRRRVRIAAHRQLEEGIVTQGVGVDRVFIPLGNQVDPLP